MTGSQPLLYVIEGKSSGHRLYYVRLLANAASTTVWVTTKTASESQEATTHLGELIADGRVLVRALASAAPSTSLVESLANKDVVIPDADRWLAKLARVRRGRWPRTLNIVLMNRPDQMVQNDFGRFPRVKAAGKTVLSRLALARARGDMHVVGIGDPFGVVRPESTWMSIAPDPVERRTFPDRPTARAIFGLPPDVPVVGLLGGVEERKNPDLVGHSVLSHPAGLTLLVAGRTPDAIQDRLRSLPGSESRLTIVSRHLSEAELSAAAAACDLVALLYESRQSSSGILALAAQAGVGVIVPESGMLARITSRFGSGLATEISHTAVQRALTTGLATAGLLGEAAYMSSRRLGVEEFQRLLVGRGRGPSTDGPQG